MKNKQLIVFILILFPVIIYSQEKLNLLPKPKYIHIEPHLFYKVESEYIENLHIKELLVKDISQAAINKDEAYILRVSRNGIEISAVTDLGIFRGKQTLKQLINKKKEIPFCTIIDWPSFRIRGFMQDVGRTYISVEELKKEIDKLAEYKINVFHIHLTEDIAWRIESKKYPQLNYPENMLRMRGKYYTHSEIKDLISYCKERRIMLIPEIDMPGHSAAFTRTFGFNMQSSQGMVILKELIDELCDIMDVPYIHIGTDETGFENPIFVPEMVEYIRKKGKKVISWNPGWKYKKGEIDITHLWSYRGRKQKGIPTIDSRFHYINHYDTFGDIVALYNSKIYDSEDSRNGVLGTIMCLWNDRFVKGEDEIINNNNFYPSLLAMAERSWQGGGSEYFDKNGVILNRYKEEEIDDFKDFERRLLWHKKNNFKGFPFTYYKQTNIEWNITEAFPNNGDLNKSFPPEDTIMSEYIYHSKKYTSSKALGGGIYLRHVWGNLIPSFYKNPKENHTAYAYTWIHSPVSGNFGLMAEFQNYSRSESDIPPPVGRWDYRASKIWINNKEINPPKWENNHIKRSNEVPLSNENMTNRPPLPIHLEKGWNKVLIKIPVGKFTTKETRLVKWMFSFVIVSSDGKEAAKDIIYSVDKKF